MMIYMEFFYTQVLLFAASNDSEVVLPIFVEAAKLFKGKVWLYLYITLNLCFDAVINQVS